MDPCDELKRLHFVKYPDGRGGYASSSDVSSLGLFHLFSEGGRSTIYCDGYDYVLLSSGAVKRYWVPTERRPRQTDKGERASVSKN